MFIYFNLGYEILHSQVQSVNSFVTLSTNYNLSESYDNENKLCLTNTKLAVLHVHDSEKKRLVKLSLDDSPWVKIENPREELQINFNHAGTNVPFDADIKFTVHAWIRRDVK